MEGKEPRSPILYVTQAPLTPRQWLMGMAMQAIIPSQMSVRGECEIIDKETVASEAYAMADAILAYESKVNDT